MAVRTAPRLTRSLLDAREYSYRARSLSGIYRLRTLLNAGGRFDVLHAHFGPVGNCFRFARELWRAPLVVSFHGYDFSTQPRKEGAGMYEKLFQTADLVTRFRALADFDFATEATPYKCDRCRARVTCPHWIGALES